MDRNTHLTGDIIEHEICLNAIAWQAFELTPGDIALIEQVTKYPCGAVWRRLVGTGFQGGDLVPAYPAGVFRVVFGIVQILLELARSN